MNFARCAVFTVPSVLSTVSFFEIHFWTSSELKSCLVIFALPRNIRIYFLREAKSELFGHVFNKAVYTATEVACGWAGAVMKRLTQAFGQEQ